MSPTWLDELEQSLEERLSAFLRANPYQEMLLQQQHQQDRSQSLQKQRQQLQQEAEDHRRQLLKLAESVKEWRSRADRARTAGAKELADRADAHISKLMEQGRQIWSALDALGQRFTDVEQQIESVLKDSGHGTSSLEDDWARFEAQHDLDRLRRESGQSRH